MNLDVNINKNSLLLALAVQEGCDGSCLASSINEKRQRVSDKEWGYGVLKRLEALRHLSQA